jgi:hypothetical protein
MKQTELDTIAPKMFFAARELAHSNAHASGDGAPDAFARGYVLAVAECCGALAADQCADDEEWSPAEWLTGDSDAVLDAMRLVGLDGAFGAGETSLWRDAWELYVAPSPSAFDLQNLARR